MRTITAGSRARHWLAQAKEVAQPACLDVLLSLSQFLLRHMCAAYLDCRSHFSHCHTFAPYLDCQLLDGQLLEGGPEGGVEDPGAVLVHRHDRGEGHGVAQGEGGAPPAEQRVPRAQLQDSLSRTEA